MHRKSRGTLKTVYLPKSDPQCERFVEAMSFAVMPATCFISVRAAGSSAQDTGHEIPTITDIDHQPTLRKKIRASSARYPPNGHCHLPFPESFGINIDDCRRTRFKDYGLIAPLYAPLATEHPRFKSRRLCVMCGGGNSGVASNYGRYDKGR
ncbi:hypothetical protein BC629DRAFT_1440973 [Irpex lacteus]|nr:hypothetical protein BC629DRAFT_1440973 [Irpex lacteus]